MLAPYDYLNVIRKQGVTFFTGVPDSLLKDFCACVTESLAPEDHIISANEGSAMGLAIGHYLSTGNVPLVYLQNSGLGNIINPLLSLASPEVYGVPMIIMIGWRGEPGVKDEPQHIHQGRVMIPMLEAMNISVDILSDDIAAAEAQTFDAISTAKKNNEPVVLAVRKNTFSKHATLATKSSLAMSREQAIIAAASLVENDAAIICTTGMASRELFEFRANTQSGHHRDFLTVGGMGHANQIALGVARGYSGRPVYCFDGDGAALMHMGGMATLGQSDCYNLTHIVFNNGVHASVGGQPTVGFDINLPLIAEACGYSYAVRATTEGELMAAIGAAKGGLTGPKLIEVITRPENRADIGRPTSTPADNKRALMNFLEGRE